MKKFALALIAAGFCATGALAQMTSPSNPPASAPAPAPPRARRPPMRRPRSRT